MIFLTVGTQLPFSRLIDAVDALAAQHGLEVVAQTGPYTGSASHMEQHKTLPPAEFERLFTKADRIISHAGIGTILSAKRYARPLIVLPRRHALGEHRNDHQLATAKGLSQVPGIHVAWEVEDLESLITAPTLTPAGQATGPGQERLLTRLRTFIETGH